MSRSTLRRHSRDLCRWTRACLRFGRYTPSGIAMMPKLLAMTPELDPDLRLHAAGVADWIATLSASRSA